MRKIISLQGFKGAGKDETALMLQYLLNIPKIFHNYKCFELLQKKRYRNSKFQIVKYADKIKQILSILINVPLYKFEDRLFKEQFYIDFNTLKVHFVDEVSEEKILSDSKFIKEIKRLDKNLTKNYYLSIRQVLQFYGTEIMRHYFGDNIWILSLLNTKYQNIIISDQRFINENEISKDNGSFIIHITRANCYAGTHSSESELQLLYENNQYDYLLKNDGDFKNLFAQCKKVVKIYKNL